MEAVKKETALARREESSGWTPAQVDAVKRQICPKGITDDDLALFVSQCERSGLDPFQKQAFCVPRRVNVGSREHPQWVTRHEMQPAEAGLLARAEDFPDFRGVTAAPVYAKDECRIDNGSGEVHHVVNVTGDRGALVGAWARGCREGRVPVVAYLRLADYQQDSPLWKKLAPTMITKCARVAVLRVMFSKQFGGLYIPEEMPAPALPAPRRAGATHYQGPQLAAPVEEAVAETPHDPETGEVQDAEVEPASDAQAPMTEDEEIAGWLGLIAEAPDMATLAQIANDAKKQASPAAQSAVSKAWASRRDELKATK